MPVFGQGASYDEELEEEVTPEESTEQEEPIEQEEHENVKKPKPTPVLLGSIVGIVILLITAVIMVAWLSSVRSGKVKAKEKEDARKDQLAYEEFYNQFPEMRPVAEESEPDIQTYSYALDDVKILRKWGYTASELEVASRDGVSAKALVEQAKADREEAQKEALQAVSDTASPEYQNLLNKTWLGGDAIDLSDYNPEVILSTNEYTENVDYEKCGAQGRQLFLKLYLNDGTCAFMSVTPSRYNELPDSGNIVVRYSTNESTKFNVIVDIEEVRVD